MPGRTAAIPARTSTALTSGRAPSCTNAASHARRDRGERVANALLPRRAAEHDDGASSAARTLRPNRHRRENLFGRDDERVRTPHSPNTSQSTN
jgi:hypothetical protein